MIRAAFSTLDLTRRIRGVLVATAALGAFAVPASLLAQDMAAAPADATGARTHTVKQGDTLWDISREYLGDPFLWPEIYRVNTDVVEDPHWIYPGENLRIPGSGGDLTASTTSSNADTSSAQPATDEPAATAPTSGETVFGRQMQAIREGEAHRGALVGRTTPVAITVGEFLAAPYLDRLGGPEGAGRILRSAEINGINMSSTERRVQINETVYLTPPAGVTPTVGTRFLVYSLGPLINGAQVITPTGVIMVTNADNGAMLGRLVQAFDNVELEQKVIPLAAFQETHSKPIPFDGVMGAKVIWLQGDPELPSIQHYIMLDATDRQGLHAGDEFALIRGASMANGSPIPEHRIATARVVRVTPYGTTALIVAQTDPGIDLNMPARLVTKMP